MQEASERIAYLCPQDTDLVLKQWLCWYADNHKVPVLSHCEGVRLLYLKEPGTQRLFHEGSSFDQTQSLLGDVNCDL